MKVKTPKDLHQVALSKGAKVTGPGGKVINASKKKAAQAKPRPEQKPQQEAKPVPAPAPAPPPQDNSGLKELGDKIGDIGKANVMMLAELKKEISDIQLQAAEPPREWVFDMIRDDKGYLVQIKASAQYVPRNLN